MITNYSCWYTVQHHQSVKRSSDSVPPPAKRPATSVDLSDIPDGTLGEWLCKHTIHDLLYWVWWFHSLTDIDSHLRLLMVALSDIAHQWEHLGDQLGLKYSKLEAIDRSKRGIPMNCMREMLAAWLQGSGAECSKQALIIALQNIRCF